MKEREQRNIVLMESRDYYAALSLEDCELVLGSVRTFTDYYRLVFGDGNYRINLHEGGIEEELFDERGVYLLDWGDSFGDDDERGFIALVKRDDDGSMKGMVYRTPPRTP
jgi:hypothetical protein